MNSKFVKRFNASIFLLLFLSVLGIFTYTAENETLIGDQSGILNPDNTIDGLTLEKSGIGEDIWWNSSFNNRRLLLIENPGSNPENLDNFITYVVIDYATLLSEGKIQADCEDIRIVEQDVVLDYYFKKDFNYTSYSEGILTIYFKKNVTGYDVISDTYLYYGNPICGNDPAHFSEDSFGLIHQYDFEDRGEVAYDAAGNLDGEMINMDSSDFTSGVVGDYALNFDGINQAINLTDDVSFNMGDEFTFTCWVNQRDDNNLGYVAGNGGGWNEDGFHVMGFSNGYRFEIQGDGYKYEVDSSDTPDDTWMMLTLTYNSSQMAIYINSDVNATRGISDHDIGDSDNAMIIGWNYYESASSTNCPQYFDGLIDDVRFYNYSLSEAELDMIYNDYKLIVTPGTEQELGAEVNITVKNIDGLLVENAEVILWNNSEILDIPDEGEAIKLSDSEGIATFAGVPFGTYNISVNYTISSDLGIYEAVIYDSGLETGMEVEFQGLTANTTLYTNLWEIEFEVDDNDGEPMNYGYVDVSYGGNSAAFLRLNLDAEGKSTFSWLASYSYYNYSVFYKNPDYEVVNTLINSSSIYRAANSQLYNVNESDSSVILGEYQVINTNLIEEASSGYNGNEYVVEARISCSDMLDNLTKINTFYYYHNDVSYTLKEQKLYENSEVEEELVFYPYLNGESIYGIRTEFTGENSTNNNGIVNIELTQNYYQYIQVDMSKLSIKIMDKTGTEPISGLTVRVLNNETGAHIVDLTTDSNGYAYGDYTNDFGFWYKSDQSYNISLYLASELVEFRVNVSDQSIPAFTYWYNYTLNSASELEFNLNLYDYTQRVSEFINETGPDDVVWGEDLSFSVVYQSSSDGGVVWFDDYYQNNSYTSSSIAIYDQYSNKLYEEAMSRVDDISSNTGNFSISVDSSQFSAGVSGKYYYAYITGHKDFWNDPDVMFFGFVVLPKEASVEVCSYDDLVPLEDNEVEEYYGNDVNITLRYFDSDSDATLTPESILYSWSQGSSEIYADSINTGYYTFTIDTTDVLNSGVYPIAIDIELENYSKIVDFDVTLTIENRPTTLNETDSVYYISESIFVKNAEEFIFEYTDSLTSTSIEDPDEMSFILQKLDDNGDPIVSSTTEGNLIENVDHDYVLDLNTESLEYGEYSVVVTMHKRNYDYKVSIMSLKVNKRTFGAELSISEDITIQSSASLAFSLDLSDLTNDSASVEGCNVYMIIGETRYDFTEEGEGVYSIDLAEFSDPFFAAEFYSPTVYIEKENYETKSISLTIKVEMAEIFDGFPTFYFLMIVGLVSAVILSLVIYTSVQKARIPEFIKKSDKVISSIKSGKKISENYLYPEKNVYVANLLGSKYAKLGISLDDKLGVVSSKKSKSDSKKQERTLSEGGIE